MIENELKYVLRWDTAFEEELRSQHVWFDIEQAYLDERARIRRKLWLDAAGIQRAQYLFTFKQRLPTGRNVEIETAIIAQDYDHLYGFSTHRLQKGRVSIRQHDVVWDIDFPRWNGRQYFVIAEVEMPPAMECPPSIPEIIQSRMVFPVPRDDGRFSARKLSDDVHARALAMSLDLLADGVQQSDDRLE